MHICIGYVNIYVHICVQLIRYDKILMGLVPYLLWGKLQFVSDIICIPQNHLNFVYIYIHTYLYFSSMSRPLIVG